MLKLEKLSGLSRQDFYDTIGWSKQRYQHYIGGGRRLTLQTQIELKKSLKGVIPTHVFLSLCNEALDF